MALLRGKQININDVLSALENIFTTNQTALTEFINSLGGYGANNKVQATSLDPNPSNFLVNKLTTNNSVPGLNLQIQASADNSTVSIVPQIDFAYFSAALLNNIFVTFITATGPMPTYVNTTVFDQDTLILIVTREGREIYQGTASDEYQYSSAASTITFNTPLQSGERVKFVTVDQTVTVPNTVGVGAINTIEFTTVAGQTSYQNNALIGATLIYMSMEDHPLFTGSSSDETTGLNNTTGTITWNTATTNPLRTIIIYKK